ncbi:hypothetical protein LF1_41130 [Rubripirellula obstinata]|uniref:VWFA domain-containing protein n=1 Tax=Rubripirellula obstinata TaxID=406547 RepID=A0A5B1CQA4_9BACT|nr:hypothetical protein [Rubripirellula obstinata]KAA1261563.1 hypothetical protein LF1_41130 [Rubripirellula obstinata]
MTDLNQDNQNNLQSSGDHARQLLELELQKIRSQASAARLDARAAEIEIVIKRLKEARSSDEIATQELEDQRLRIDAPPAASPANLSPPNQTSDQADGSSDDFVTSVLKPRHRFASWNDLRSAQIAANDIQPSDIRNSDIQPSVAVEASVASTDQNPILRFDARHKVASSHHLPVDHSETNDEIDDEVDDEVVANPVDDTESDSDPAARESSSLFTTDEEPLPTLDHDSIVFAGQLSETWNTGEEPPTKKRGKSAAMLVSAVVHVGALFLLAEVALQLHEPKDQVALTASASSGEETAMQSFSIESFDEPEPETEVTEPTPTETEYEVSPIGEFKAADFSTDAIASPVSSMAAAMTSQSDPSVTATMLKSDSVSKIKFCGVEGGGNHFVYLVDSSGSMGDAFESARRALLQSIDLLTPDQRFYVVFFDSQPDFMRISNPGIDEPRSVYATEKNKAALRRWAMRISMDRGKAPYDPLKFALGLRADVIFLLSDGEFPEGIPKLLKEQNRVDNLFGETKPISIVHTIGYFSKEGANIMTRIAKENRGQYRHVPKP